MAAAGYSAHRLNRVLHNVTGNAIKFTPQGGQIAISITTDGSWVLWSCRDTGCGVAPDQIGELGQELLHFDPSRSQGMGLGLYTSTHIVRASGGQISYSSPGVGQGTTVQIRLPLAPDLPLFTQLLAAQSLAE